MMCLIFPHSFRYNYKQNIDEIFSHPQVINQNERFKGPNM